MFGTDWPHQVFDTEGAVANTARLSEETRVAIRAANAQRIFDL
jgi:predicted TIM-barrel fold metal-dependent hydrolase